jgi:hypothetical protein
MITYFGLSRKNSAAAIVFCVPFNTKYRFIENIQMANQENIEQHKKILGILHIVFGALQFALIMLATLIVSSIIPIHVHDFEELMVINIVKYAVISLTVVLTTPAIIAGIGLLYKKDWALTLAFVIGIIGLLGFPDLDIHWHLFNHHFYYGTKQAQRPEGGRFGCHVKTIS